MTDRHRPTDRHHPTDRALSPDRPGADRYGSDVLAGDWRSHGRPPAPARVPADRGTVVETEGGFVGAVLRVQRGTVELEDRTGRVRVFPLGGGFLVDGLPVVLTPPTAMPTAAARTLSGSRAAAPQRARVARASRILVEGRHDAELVEKVWGADLRAEGVVVELLDGVDNLAAALAELRPAADARIGVLVDHLVPGSKESRLVADVRDENVLVVGHPYVDVWQSVRPARLGWDSWPEVPRQVEWKHGICAALGWPHAEQEDVARAWQRILGRVRDYRDLEPSLTGRVEQLIDFVTTER